MEKRTLFKQFYVDLRYSNVCLWESKNEVNLRLELRICLVAWDWQTKFRLLIHLLRFIPHCFPFPPPQFSKHIVGNILLIVNCNGNYDNYAWYVIRYVRYCEASPWYCAVASVHENEITVKKFAAIQFVLNNESIWLFLGLRERFEIFTFSKYALYEVCVELWVP